MSRHPMDRYQRLGIGFVRQLYLGALVDTLDPIVSYNKPLWLN